MNIQDPEHKTSGDISQKRPNEISEAYNPQAKTAVATISDSTDNNNEHKQKKITIDSAQVNHSSIIDQIESSASLVSIPPPPATNTTSVSEEGGSTDEADDDDAVLNDNDDNEEDFQIPDPSAILASLVNIDLPTPSNSISNPSSWLKAPTNQRSTRVGVEYQAEI